MAIRRRYLTYLHTEEGWLYLAVIIDLYSRRVIGWAMSERMTAELACDALRMALRIEAASTVRRSIGNCSMPIGCAAA